MTTASRGLRFPSFNFPDLGLSLTNANTTDWRIFTAIRQELFA